MSRGPLALVDVDIAVRLDDAGCSELVRSFDADFYVPSDAARVAGAEHASFNVVDTTSGLKIDLFVVGDGELDAMQMERRIQVTLPGVDRPIWVTAPEVQILRKLDWYVRGGEVSDRQWHDVVSILRITTGLDLEFLSDAARRLGLERLLADARRQAG